MLPAGGLLLALLGGAPALADDSFEQAVAAELREVDPDAAALLSQADEARAKGDLAAAGALYAQLVERLPEDDHSRRRHCLVLQELGVREQAMLRCEEALALKARPENRVALAMVLLDLPSGAQRSAADLARAEQLLGLAVADSTEDPMIPRLLCHLASEKEDAAGLRACLPELERLAPDHVKTAWHTWELARMEGRTDDALAALDRAQAAGMPAEDADAFRGLTRPSSGETGRWPIALAVGAVLGGLVLWLMRPTKEASSP